MSRRRAGRFAVSAAALSLSLLLSTSPFTAAAASAIAVPADSAYTAQVVARNPDATFRHDAKLVSPVSVPICTDCRIGAGPAALGSFRAGDSLAVEFTVHQSDGTVVTYRSDGAPDVTVSSLADGWRIALEDGGGPPEDLVLEIRRAAAPPPAAPRELLAGYGLGIREEGGSSAHRAEACTNGPAVTRNVRGQTVRFFLTAHHCFDGTPPNNVGMTFPERVHLQTESSDGGYHGGKLGAPVSEIYPNCSSPVCLEPARQRQGFGESRDVIAWRPNGPIVTNRIFTGVNSVATVVGTQNVGGRGGLAENSQICFFGAASGQERCGFIIRSVGTPGGGRIFGVGALTDGGTAYFKACSLSGDSGSPVYTPQDRRGQVRVVGILISSSTASGCTRDSMSRLVLFDTIGRQLGVQILT